MKKRAKPLALKATALFVLNQKAQIFRDRRKKRAKNPQRQELSWP